MCTTIDSYAVTGTVVCCVSGTNSYSRRVCCVSSITINGSARVSFALSNESNGAESGRVLQQHLMK